MYQLLELSSAHSNAACADQQHCNVFYPLIIFVYIETASLVQQESLVVSGREGA